MKTTNGKANRSIKELKNFKNQLISKEDQFKIKGGDGDAKEEVEIIIIEDLVGG